MKNKKVIGLYIRGKMEFEKMLSLNVFTGNYRILTKNTGPMKGGYFGINPEYENLDDPGQFFIIKDILNNKVYFQFLSSLRSACGNKPIHAPAPGVRYVHAYPVKSFVEVDVKDKLLQHLLTLPAKQTKLFK